jgi:UDP-N-acetylglucosamine--N-acetylmuramyl-(pentapeptide) pyrophosphoryl-undecaprenol N-acetylglucosamine transferase
VAGEEVRILLAAGGTGGHVFPALALASELRRLGAEIVWMGRRSGLECEVAQVHGFRFEPMAAAGFFGKGILTKVAAMVLAAVGFFRALWLVARLRPDGVVAAGGFVSAAVLAAAQLTGLPFFLLEQNCVPGRVTRMFAGRAKESYLALPTVKEFPGPHVVSGNPLRDALVQVAKGRQGGAVAGRQTVLVLGGSGGAQALSLAGLDAAAALPNCRFIILAGKRDYARVRSLVRSRNCEVVEFTSHPEDLYRQATLAVSRAGSVVLSELAAFGIPSVLVPFPYAVDQHQDANARYMASAGAAVVLEQASLSALVSTIQELVDNKERMKQMAQAARAAAHPDAGADIAGRILAQLADAGKAGAPRDGGQERAGSARSEA